MWRRDLSSEAGGFPKEYRRWGEGERTGEGEVLVVQDLRPEDDEAAVSLMVEHFIRDEPTCRSTGVADAVTVREMCEFWRRVVTERLSLACYQLRRGFDPRIVGLNMCYLNERGAPKPDLTELKSATWRQILGTLLAVEAKVDVHAVLGESLLLGACGLLVLPEMRGRGIATQLVAAREELCRAVGLGGSSTVFTATGSQRVAELCGFSLLAEVTYEELGRTRGWHFPGIDTPSARLMAVRYPRESTADQDSPS